MIDDMLHLLTELEIENEVLFRELLCATLMKRLQILQESRDSTMPVYLKGSRAFYYQTQCNGRLLGDVDLAAADPVVALMAMGVRVEKSGDDFAAGAITCAVQGKSCRLNVEAVRLLQPIPTLTVQSIPVIRQLYSSRVADILQYMKLPTVSLECVSIRPLIIEKIFCIAYYIQNYSSDTRNSILAKNLFDLSFLRKNAEAMSYLQDSSAMLAGMVDHIKQEALRPDHITTISQVESMLTYISASTLRICSSIIADDSQYYDAGTANEVFINLNKIFRIIQLSVSKAAALDMQNTNNKTMKSTVLRTSE